MKIYLMRHGQTTGDLEDRFGGDYEDHLTELGQKQAEELAEKISSFGIKKIFYSPRIRAMETAKIVNEKTNILLKKLDDLRERNAYGILTGELKEVSKKQRPDLIEKLKDPKATIEGAEEYGHFKNRVLNVFSQVSEQDYDIVGIITHGGVISCFLREVIGRERKSLDDCAIIELDFTGGKYQILSSEGLELE